MVSGNGESQIPIFYLLVSQYKAAREKLRELIVPVGCECLLMERGPNKGGCTTCGLNGVVMGLNSVTPRFCDVTATSPKGG